MPPFTKKLSECLADAVSSGTIERDALFAHLALAEWLVCTDPEILAKLSGEVLLKANTALRAAEDWLEAWQKVVNLANQRVCTNLPDNVIILGALISAKP